MMSWFEWGCNQLPAYGCEYEDVSYMILKASFSGSRNLEDTGKDIVEAMKKSRQPM